MPDADHLAPAPDGYTVETVESLIDLHDRIHDTVDPVRVQLAPVHYRDDYSELDPETLPALLARFRVLRPVAEPPAPAPPTPSHPTWPDGSPILIGQRAASDPYGEFVVTGVHGGYVDLAAEDSTDDDWLVARRRPEDLTRIEAGS